MKILHLSEPKYRHIIESQRADMFSAALRHQQRIKARCFHPSKQWVAFYYRAYFIDQTTTFPDERVAVGYALPGSTVQLDDNRGNPVADLA